MSRDEIYKFNNILKRISLGDKSSFEELYCIYGRLIYITAFTVVKAKPLAEEVVDDVFVKVWQFSKEKKKIRNPKGWLYTLTMNVAKNKIKEEKQPRVLFGTEADVFQELLDVNEFYSDIRDLNEFEQKIMILKFVGDMTFSEISKQTKLPLGSITSAYYRSLEKIKEKKNKKLY